DNLNDLLEDPDEVWRDEKTIDGTVLNIYIRNFGKVDIGDGEEAPLYHVAVVYLTDNVPTFVYLHFPTLDDQLVEKYRRGEKVYDRVLQGKVHGAVEGDALYEGDEFAKGLYQAMMKVRSDSDISDKEFVKY
ncbi:MAG: peptidase, partial [Phototrophicales bacterium]